MDMVLEHFDGSPPNVKTWIDRTAKEWYQMAWNTFGAATLEQWKKLFWSYFCRKRCTHSMHALYLNGMLALWLCFIIIPAAPSPLKRFLEPSDIETASRPFTEDVVYADKTNHVLNLFQTGKRFFFVRPRRFGKSSFLRTLERILDGTGRGVFNGTYIHTSNYDWDSSSYPVMYLDLGQDVIEDGDTCGELMRTPRSLTLLERKIDAFFRKFKTMHCLSTPKKTRFSDEFRSILEGVNAKGNLTVVLIDEYDFAILNNMQTCPVAAEINTILVRNIFLQFKECGGLIKFAFVTGISKAVFSILGTAFDLKDITHNPDFLNIAGLTEADLNEYYCDHIDAASNYLGEPRSEVLKTLKGWYDGYNFSTRVRSSLYNPLSVHSYLENREARGYWADKGHAKFLYDEMTKRINEFMGLNLKNGVRSHLIGGRRLNTTDPGLLLYDAGYLTIQSSKNGIYELRFPNQEMEEAFYRDISDAAKEAENGTTYEIRRIGESLRRIPPSFQDFVNALDTAIMKIGRFPFEEWYDYQTMKLIRDANVYAERQTPINTIDFGGKIIDVTGHTENTHFLFEIKFNKAGNYDAWAAVNKSIKTILHENRMKREPFQFVLAAGITFTEIEKERSIQYYQAKLFNENGALIENYQSENLEKSQSERPNTQKPPLFLMDHLFEESNPKPCKE